MKVLWIVGEPGVGKTALARVLLGPIAALHPKPKWTLGRGGRVVAAGHYVGGPFDGGDTVPYSGAQEALDFWLANLAPTTPRLTIFDGDRFSHGAALDFFTGMSFTLVSVLLEAPPEVAAQRRRDRGSQQDPSWIQGRKTKSARFHELVTNRITVVSALATPESLARTVCNFLDDLDAVPPDVSRRVRTTEAGA